MVWVGQPPPGQQEKWGPYCGCLIVMNVGKMCPPIPQSYDDTIQDEIAQAHANGWLVLYAFDRGVSPPEEHWDYIEGLDHIRLMHDACGRKDADFSVLPDARAKEFSEMAKRVFSRPCFEFQSTYSRIVGRCRIGGKDCLIPPTKCS